MYAELKKAVESYINENRRQIHIGYYATVDEAVKARDAEAKKRRGKFAYLNSTFVKTACD